MLYPSRSCESTVGLKVIEHLYMRSFKGAIRDAIQLDNLAKPVLIIGPQSWALMTTIATMWDYLRPKNDHLSHPC